MKRLTFRKLKEKQGESIAETLYATLIISAAFLVLTGGIISAASINAKIKNQDTSVNIEGAGVDTSVPGGSVVFSDSTGTQTYPTTKTITFHTTEGDEAGAYRYIYYEENE